MCVYSVRDAAFLISNFHIFLGKTEATIKNFSPYYSRQYSVAFCNHVRSEVEQQRDFTSQFLKTKVTHGPLVDNFSHWKMLYNSSYSEINSNLHGSLKKVHPQIISWSKNSICLEVRVYGFLLMV